MDYRYGSQTVYQIECHFVWVTKDRYKVLQGELALRVDISEFCLRGYRERAALATRAASHAFFESKVSNLIPPMSSFAMEQIKFTTALPLDYA